MLPHGRVRSKVAFLLQMSFWAAVTELVENEWAVGKFYYTQGTATVACRLTFSIPDVIQVYHTLTRR